jgi:glycopeptide antibiotics resistance protein
VTTGGPWSNFVGHSHWVLVEWVPFSRGVFPFDIVANIALFVPLGLTLGWHRSSRTRLAAVLLGALLSLSIEVFQVFTHGRIATITDVLTNTCGAAIGASLAARRSARAIVQPQSSLHT